ncbi:MFS transporter [Bifidobacterium sp. LC6]|uniref:MFS transporter n=1 Tax=Bifidobacterium colobi TaxID=2809026 RepID=A0ABS5UUD2_9BIFI|nr:MFS transporter [Bifidobacterium colobi]MBT1174368.1 MFS transporter [Bifidobacterium colobi]
MAKSQARLKIGILSIAVMMQAASAISAAVPDMVETFSDHSTTSVQALVTIPSFSVMLFILLSSAIVKLIGKRNTVLLGLALSLVGGVIPAFTENFVIIEIGRFLFGAGTGMYTPLAVSLIGDFFTGDEQRNLVGYRSAISAFGSSLATFGAGLLLTLGWHQSYLVYGVLVAVIALFVWGYPKDADKKAEQEAEAAKAAGKGGLRGVSPIVWFGILMLFVYFNGMMVTYTSSGLAIKQMNLANQGMLSTSLAVAGFLGALVTMTYGRVFRVLGHFTPVVVMTIGAIGMFGMTVAGNMWVFTIFLIMTCSTSMLIPYVYGAILDDVPAGAKNLVISIAMAVNNCASFLSPYTVSFLGKIIGHTDSISSMRIAACLFIIDIAVFVVLAFARKKQQIASAAKNAEQAVAPAAEQVKAVAA